METNIHLDERLLAEARSFAEKSARSLSQVVEEALREKLAKTLVAQSKPTVSTSSMIHPDVQRITGLAPAEQDPQAAYLAHLAKRHQ